MKREEYEKKIQDTVQEKKKKIVFKSLVKIVSEFLKMPIYDICFGIEDNIEKEENKAEQKIIIDMLSDIQNALVKANKKVVQLQLTENKINFLGNLKLIVKHADSVTGVEITDSAKNVEFKSGTNIQIKGNDVKKSTGVKIGKDNNS